MRISFGIVAAALAAAAVLAGTAPALAVDNVPFTVVNGGQIQVEGSIDGVVTVPMLVNTGAGVDVLSTAFGRRYVHVDSKYASLRLTGERVDLPIGTVGSLAIGGVRIVAPHVGIWGGLDAMGINGLIAATAFRNITTTFDFANHQIVVEDAATFPDRVRTATRVPLVLQDDLGVALALFARFDFGNGKTGLCEIDTGSEGITLDRTFAASIGVEASGKSAAVPSITLAGAPRTETSNPNVTIGNLIYDCDVGNSFWTGRSFTLDIPNHYLYVSG